LTAGLTYTFKVEARNQVGYSELSESISILAAQIADVPTAPTTTIDGALIIITWLSPFNGATAITSYTVTIRQADGDYSENLAYCNGALATVISQRVCQIPVSILRNAPYNHDWGVSIWAKVSATNIIGTSGES
jgi:hypothetical protein